MSAQRARGAWPWALVALAAAGAALRFSTLSVQSFWLDEAVTHQLVTRSLGAMLRAIPHSESTPPLYYVLAWAWVRVFGAGETGLRSLSAVFGTATIVLVALVARRAAGDRASLAAAALAAASPLLIWYSQEARAYALLGMLVALSILCLQRERFAAWGLVAALALATHYFAIFVVVPEGAWVAWRYARGSRRALAALAGVLAVGAALLPLAIVQAGGSRAAFIRTSSLASRTGAVPKQFLVGYATPHATLLTVIAAVLALGLALSVRRRDGPLLALAASAAVVPALLALAGADYLITRNVLAALVPLIVVGGATASRTRAGPALVAGLCAVGVVAYVGVETNVAYQRDDWRGVARALGAARAGPRAVVVDPASGVPALRVYAPLTPMAPTGSLSTREVDVILLDHHPRPLTTTINLPGFVTAALVQTAQFTLVRYRASTPVPITYAQLVGVRLAGAPPAVLIGAQP
jgi:mannosyltransferase